MRNRRFEYPKPSFVHGRPVREHLISAGLDFVEAASQLPGVERLAFVGSICTTKANPKDVDVLVTIAPSVDMEKLAALGRKLQGRAQSINCGADIFLADLDDRYLGRTCSWKICKPWVRMSCQALNCGAVPYLSDDFQCIKLNRELIANPMIVIHPRIVVRDGLPKDLIGEVRKRIETPDTPLEEN